MESLNALAQVELVDQKLGAPRGHKGAMHISLYCSMTILHT